MTNITGNGIVYYKMVGDLFSEDAKTKIQAWLMQDGWSLSQADEGVAWAFIAEDRLKRKVVVGQPKGRPDELVIQGAIKFDETMTKKAEQLPKKEQDEFLWELRFELVRTNLEFSGIKMPLKRIEVSERIFLDDLTKDSFLQRVSQVRKGVLIILWMLSRKFEQEPPKREFGFQR